MNRAKWLQDWAAGLMPSTIRGRLLLVLFVVLVPILALQAYVYYNRYQDSRSAELTTDQEMARAVSVTFDAYLQDVLHQELAIGLAFTSPTPLAPGLRNDYLITNTQDYPTVGNFEWLDPRGLVVNSSEVQRVGADLRDSSYYRDIVAGRPWAVGDLAAEPVTGEASFVIARGIRDSQGDLQGLVLAIVDSLHLGRVFQMELARQGTFVIFDSAGRIVYQRPEASLAWEARDPPLDTMLRAGLAGRETAGTFSTANRQAWMGAASPIASIGWVTRAGRPETEINNEIIQDLGRDLALFCLVALGAMLVAVFVSRSITVPVKQVSEYAANVGSGEAIGPPQVISAPREMYELSATLSRMADKIRDRERWLRREVAASDRSNVALRVAEQRLLMEREQERKALARELHDRVIQDLIGVRFELEGLTTAGSPNGNLKDVQDSVGTLIDEVRDICTNLRPPTIDSLGLVPAVQSYIDEWSARTGIVCKTELDAKLGRLPEMTELSVFRIIQEGLNNMWKHADAKVASIRLKRNSGRVVSVEISDDGQGMPGNLDLPALAASGHYGLVGIGERVTLLGGSLKVRSQPGFGFRLEVVIPAPLAAARRAQ